MGTTPEVKYYPQEVKLIVDSMIMEKWISLWSSSGFFFDLGLAWIFLSLLSFRDSFQILALVHHVLGLPEEGISNFPLIVIKNMAFLKNNLTLIHNINSLKTHNMDSDGKPNIFFLKQDSCSAFSIAVVIMYIMFVTQWHLNLNPRTCWVLKRFLITTCISQRTFYCT